MYDQSKPRIRLDFNGPVDHDGLMIQRRAQIALFTLISLSTAACHKPATRDLNAIYVGLSNTPTTLDPRFATDANSERITDLIFSSLVRNGPDLKPVPQAAEKWKIEDKRVTLKIRPDLKFHNGRQVTMDDVIFSLNEYRKTSSGFAGELSAIDSVKTDGWNLVLELKRNDGPLLTNLAYVKILPREEIEKFGDSFTDHPVGSGPYRFESMDYNHIVLVKSNTAPYAEPKISKVVFKVIRDDNTRYLKMLKGDIDILLNELPEEKAVALEKSGKADVLVTPGLNFNYILLNLHNDKLIDRDVRQALFSALDRKAIIEYKLENLAFEAASILAPANPFAVKDLK
jgi:ABC-type transport system substrate-binding protein